VTAKIKIPVLTDNISPVVQTVTRHFTDWSSLAPNYDLTGNSNEYVRINYNI
jgi:hypothetical protein